MEVLTKFVTLLLSFLLLFSQSITVLPFSFTLDDTPEEVKMYLTSDEEVEEAFRITYSKPPLNGNERKELDLIFYIIKKGDRSTGEYIIWDNVLKSVVGGYKWEPNFDTHSYKTIISYIERDKIASFINKVFSLTNEFKKEIEDLKTKSEDLMKDLKKEQEFWGIVAGAIVGAAVSFLTAGAALPLALSLTAVVIMTAWRLDKLKDIVVNWDVKPQKYPEYFLTIVMLSQFSDKNSIEASASELKNAIEGVVDNDDLTNSLVDLHKYSSTVLRTTLEEVGRGFGETLFIHHLSIFLGTSIPISIHAARGVLGNEKFYEIFGKGFVEKIESFSYRILGGEAELGVEEGRFKEVLNKIGKVVASNFRAKAISGISKEKILQSFKEYEDMMTKIFTKDALLKSFKVSVISVGAQLLAEYSVKKIVEYFRANVEDVAANGYLHADVSTTLLDTIKIMKEKVGQDDAYKNYAVAVIGYWYADRFFNNYVEFWNLTANIFETHRNLLGNDKLKEHLGSWFSGRCNFTSFPSDYRDILQCAKDRVEKIYIEFKHVIEEFIYIDERISNLVDSYIANMSRRLANAIPKVARQADIILTLDTSGSMGEVFLQKTKIDVLKDAARSLINLFNTTRGGIRAGIVIFNTTANLKSDLTDDYELLDSIISGLVAGGNTAMGDALHISLETLLRQKNERFKAIILITDGKSNTGRDPKEVLDKELAPASIPVFTIGIGKGGAEYDAEILKRISDVTKGAFYEVDPSKGVEEGELIRIFLKIGLSVAVGGQPIREEVKSISQGERIRYDINATDGKPFAIIATYSGSKVRLNLYTPLGELMTPSLSSIYISSEGFEAWIVRSPEPGVWTAELIGEDVPTQSPIPVFLSINKPSIEVEPEYAEVVITQPGSQEIVFKIKSIGAQPVRDLKTSLWGGIKQIAKIEPELIPTIPVSGVYKITLKITAPQVEGIYDGFIELNDGWFVIRIPVKVTYRKLIVNINTDKASYLVNDVMKVYALVEDNEGKRVTDAEVSLLINSTSTVKLLDDGKDPDEKANDGIYSSIIKAPPTPRDMVLTAIVRKNGYPTAYTSLIVMIEKPPETTTTPTIITTPSPTEGITIFTTSPTSGITPVIAMLTAIVLIALFSIIGLYVAKRPICSVCKMRASSRKARFCRRCGTRLK